MIKPNEKETREVTHKLVFKDGTVEYIDDFEKAFNVSIISEETENPCISFEKILKNT